MFLGLNDCDGFEGSMIMSLKQRKTKSQLNQGHIQRNLRGTTHFLKTIISNSSC